jgi:hypothetical protein
LQLDHFEILIKDEQMSKGGAFLSVQEQPDNPFYKEYEPRTQGEREAWACVDDRTAGFLHLQVAGGVIGLASGRAAAMERQRRGSFIDMGRPITVLAGVSAEIVAPEMELLRHAKCGREAHAPAITRKIHQEPERVFPLANLINDNITPKEFDTFVDIYRALDEANLVETDAQADRLLAGGGKHTSGLYVPPVRRVDIMDAPHEAERFKVNRGRSAFDNAAAWETEPSYNLSMGRLPEAHATMNRYLGHVPEAHFMAAVAIESAATALALEELTDKQFMYEFHQA